MRFGTFITIIGFVFATFGMFEFKETTFGYFSIMSAFGLTWMFFGIIINRIDKNKEEKPESYRGQRKGGNL